MAAAKRRERQVKPKPRPDDSAPAEAVSEPRPQKPRKWGRTVVAGVAGAAVLIMAVLWWQERPLDQAERALQAGETDVALHHVEQFLLKNPTHSRGQSLKARILIEQQRYGEALAIFDVVGAAEIPDLAAWARGLMAAGRFTEALPLLDQVVTTRPADAQTLEDLALCRFQLGYFAMAVDQAEQLATLPASRQRGLMLAANFYQEMGRLPEALDAWLKVLKENPDGEGLMIPAPQLFMLVGNALLKLDRAEEALPYLERSAELAPVSIVMASLGAAQWELGQSDEAEKSFARALADDATLPEARIGLARVALKKQDGKAAAQWLRPMIEQRTVDSTTADLLSQAFSQLGEVKAAAQWRVQSQALAKREQTVAEISTVINDAPRSNWSQVLRAYRAALLGNWEQAEAELVGLQSGQDNAEFVSALVLAIRQRGALPELPQPLRQ